MKVAGLSDGLLMTGFTAFTRRRRCSSMGGVTGSQSADIETALREGIVPAEESVRSQLKRLIPRRRRQLALGSSSVPVFGGFVLLGVARPNRRRRGVVCV